MARVQMATNPNTRLPSRASSSRGSDSQSRGDSSEDQSKTRDAKMNTSALNRGRNRRQATPALGRLSKGNNTAAEGSADSGEDDANSGDSGEASDDESESDDDQPVGLAPSGATRKHHSRQTGLSISLSQSSLSVELDGKKRGRSPASSGTGDDVSRPNKLAKIASGAVDLLNSSSDDDIYNAVDLISDSEDEKDVERVEEVAIMASEDDVVATADVNEYSRHFADATDDFDTEGNQSFNETLTPTKRVHWADDVFYMGCDGSRFMTPARNEGRWEAPDGDEAESLQVSANNPAEWGVDLSTQGSDLDWGDTTDEESLPIKTVHRPNERLHDVRDKAKTESARHRGPSSAYQPLTHSGPHEGPSLGSWVVDPTKPIAVTDQSGTRLVYFPPSASQPTSSQESSGEPPSPKAKLMAYLQPQDDGSETEEEEGVNRSFQDAVLGPVADQMYSVFQQGAERINKKQSSLDTPAAHAGLVQNVNANDWDESEDESDSAGEKHLRIQDLVDLGDSGSDSEGENANEPAAPAEPTLPADARLRASSSSPDPLSAPSWPVLHRPSPRLGGNSKDRSSSSRSSLSPTSSRASAKVAAKLQSMNPGAKRLKARHSA